MDDKLFRALRGIGALEKIYSQNKMMDSIAKLANPLNIHEWAMPKSEVTMMNVVFGNTSQMMAVMMEMPQLPNSVMAAFGSTSHLSAAMMGQPKVPNSVMAAFGNVSHLINNTPPRNPILDNSISALFGFPKWHSINTLPESTYPIFDISKSLVSLKAEEIISQNQFSFRSTSKAKEKSSSIEDNSITDEIQNILTQSVNRYVKNIGNVISEVSEIDEDELSEIKSNFNKAFKQEIAVATVLPLTLFVLENILNHYNEILESIINAGNISEDFLQNILKTTNPESANFSAITWIFFIIVTGWTGSYTYDKFIKGDKVKTNLEKSIMNAVTINNKKVLSKPHGSSKVVCEIPKSTKVQLDSVKGKYISIKFIHEGSQKAGWTKNEDLIND